MRRRRGLYRVIAITIVIMIEVILIMKVIVRCRVIGIKRNLLSFLFLLKLMKV